MSYFEDNYDRIVFGRPSRRYSPPRNRVQVDRNAEQDYSKVTWTTGTGEVLKVSEMMPSHRQNSLKVLVRRHGKQAVAQSTIGKALLHFGASLEGLS